MSLVAESLPKAKRTCLLAMDATVKRHSAPMMSAKKLARPTHRFECLPSLICEERISRVKLHWACGCRNRQGYEHIKCVAELE